MLFLIRETLIINWGRGNISVMKKDGENKEDTTKELVCRDFINCEYCKAENESRKKEYAKLIKESKKTK